MTKQQTDNEIHQETNLGDLFLKTRKALHKTLEEASEATRINITFLHALEQNDFEKLPDEIFTRGFIKLYASYLGLDPSDTFAHYITQENLIPNKPVARLQRSEITNSELLDRTSIFLKRSSRILPITILLSILVLFYSLGIFFKSEEQSPNKLQEDAAIALAPMDQSPQVEAEKASNNEKDKPAKKKVAAPAEQPSKPVAPQPPVKSPTKAKQAIKAENIATPKPAPATIKQPAPQTTATIQPVEPIDPATLPITVKVATSPAADIDFQYILEARFEEASLLRIKVDDKPQLQYNSQAGIVRRWRAHQRIVLELDNSTGVTLILNGQPLPITTSDGTTATINIPADIPTSDNP